MTGAHDRPKFEYSAEQIREIEKYLPLNRLQRTICLNISILPAVRDYLFALRESQMLPTRDHLEEGRKEKLAQVEAVLKMIRHPDDQTERFEKANADLMARGEPLLDVLGVLVANFDRMSSVDFEEVIACRVLKRLQESLMIESYEENVKTKGRRDFKHRNELIEKLVDVWAKTFEKPVAACEISETETSPLLTFILAVCEPVWAAIKRELGSNEGIGPGQIVNVVNDYRRRRAVVGSEMASEL